jgi:hypothetical protein
MNVEQWTASFVKPLLGKDVFVYSRSFPCLKELFQPCFSSGGHFHSKTIIHSAVPGADATRALFEISPIWEENTIISPILLMIQKKM